MYREEIKVLDCTIPDGGLINNHYFSDELVQAVGVAGVDYVEMGYETTVNIMAISRENEHDLVRIEH